MFPWQWLRGGKAWRKSAEERKGEQIIGDLIFLRKGKRMKRLHILITALVAVSVVLWGAGAVLAGDPGVTDNEIVIGTSAGLTGPIAMWGNRMARIGPQAYFNYINEQGGVHGRKINHVVLDDGYQPPRSGPTTSA
jgi:ABC-type branched-subunit amino acid transport system substrate-binding protein